MIRLVIIFGLSVLAFGQQSVSQGPPTTNNAKAWLVSCVTGCSAVTSPSFGAAFPATGTAIGAISATGNMAGLNLDASGFLKVNVAAGSGSNPAAGTTGAAVPGSADYLGINLGGTLRGVTGVNPTGSVYALQIDLASIGGNALTTTLPVSGTFWQATQPVSGTVTANAGSGTFAISAASLPLPSGASTAAKQPALGTAGVASADVLTIQGIASMTALLVDGSGFTQPVSGTVAATQSGTWNIGTLTALTSITNPVAATQSGTWNIGTVTALTGITNALPAGTNVIGHIIADTGSTTAVTGNVTVVQPTGTNLHVVVDSAPTTAVTQVTSPWIVAGGGTAGTAATGVVTIQGIASMTKLLVTPDANSAVNLAQVGGTNTVTAGVSGLLAVGGNVANAGTSTANPVPVGGIFTTVPATLTTGQVATLQFTAAQNAKHDITTIAGTAPTTAGFIDVKGADGNIFVRQATGTNLHVVLDTTSTTAVTQATATNLNAAVVGTGTAGSPAGNILTIQGVASMTKLLVTPDSVALPANQSVNAAQIGGTNTVTGGVAGLLAVGGNVANAGTATANPVPVGGIFTTTPTTLTTGQTATLQFTAAQNVKTDMSTVAGTATVTSAAGVQKVGIVGNANAAIDAATGAAPPANAILHAGLGSGATGGFLIAVPACDTFFNINISTATTTLAVTGVSGRHVRICAIDMVTAAANNVGIISGTGATCGTGSAAMVGTTAATGWNFAANGGIAKGTGMGAVMRTVATGDSVCIITSASTQLSGTISYAIY